MIARFGLGWLGEPTDFPDLPGSDAREGGTYRELA
jgi:hypothetical protein